jgi:uncharacterized membrane protein YesL
MMKLFDHSGPLMDALRKLTDLMFCNLAFCVFSLPLFTVGASLSALYTCTRSLVEDQEDAVIVRTFWRGFRRNFGQATVLWLLCLLAAAVLGAYYWAVGLMPEGMRRLYRVTFFVLCMVFLFGFQYLFPLQARYRMKTRHLLKNAWLLSIAALPWTLCSLAVTGGMVYVTLFMNPGVLNMAVFLWAVLLFAIVAYLNSFFFRQAFRRLEPVQREGEEL